ncbi:MAG: sialidase family protein, partial [Thermoplasmatota archaeon]
MGRNIQTIAAVLLLVFLVTASIQSVALCRGSISFIANSSPVLDNREQSDLDMEVVGRGNTSKIFLSYVDYSTGINSPHVHFKRSMNGGSTWSSAVDMLLNTSSGNKQLMPEMDTYTDDNGTTIALVYMDSSFRPVPGLQEFVIICALSSDNGSTWKRTLVTPMDDTGYPSDKIRNPSVKFGVDGSLFVVWEGLDGDDRIHISYSLDRGANWSDPRKVAEPTHPENTNSLQKYPDVACDGHSVFVVWEGDPSFKIGAFVSISRVPKSPDDDMEFCDPIKVAYPIYYPMYWLYTPVIEADEDRVHLAWWDFSTDENGLDDQDITRDRPCIKYTSSVDHGGNWSVGGARNIKVNRTSPNIWHSRPSMDINNGTIAISWIDRNTSGSNVVVSYSTDSGLNWSSPLRANGYRSGAVHSAQKVAVDDGGYI